MAVELSRLTRRKARGTPQPATDTLRTIGQGELIGLTAANGAHVWRGVPFAASTAGDNRWRPPRPAPAWQGRRPALESAERCAQLTNRGDRSEGLKPGLVVGSEECLALDIYAPGDAQQGKTLPVMVWIHGGGNVWGGAWRYDGSRLAVNEDVIVVVVQYRLGPLGWFSHQALRKGAEDPADAAACFATLDLIASLQWIAENITAFGGDPGCVTIFGESSGGHNVVTLLASPLATGLFHRAIVQSGSFDSVSAAASEGLEGALVNTSADIAARLGARSAEDLRAATAGEIYAACSASGGWFLDVPRVIQDGIVLPSTPLREAFASTETFNAVPIITGTNRDEMKLFYFADDSLTRKKLGFQVVPRDQTFYDAMAHYVSRVWRIRSVDQPCAAMARAGHDEVFAYRFDWDDGGRLFSMDLHTGLGAAHGFEIPFVFNRFEHLGDADRLLFGKRTRADRERLSRAMGQYWASFARDGRPSCANGPAWPAYRDGSFLRLDAEGDGGIEAEHGIDGLDAVAADLNADARLDQRQRCAIVDEMRNWMFGRPVLADLREATGCR